MTNHLNEFNLSQRIGSTMDSIGAKAREFKRNTLKSRPNLDPKSLKIELKNAWERRGRPTDSDEIISMLKNDFGYSHSDIMAAFEVTGKEEPIVKSLAEYILVKMPQQSIDEIMLFLKDYGTHYGKNKDKKVNRRNTNYNDYGNHSGFYDSIDYSSTHPSLMEDQPVSDKQINYEFETMFDKDAPNPIQTSQDPYLNKWVENFSKQADTDVKKKLVVDLVDKAPSLDGQNNKHAMDKIKSAISGDKDIKSDQTFYKNVMYKLQKGEPFTESMEDRVLAVKEMVMYGRRKKI